MPQFLNLLFNHWGDSLFVTPSINLSANSGQSFFLRRFFKTTFDFLVKSSSFILFFFNFPKPLA